MTREPDPADPTEGAPDGDGEEASAAPEQPSAGPRQPGAEPATDGDAELSVLSQLGIDLTELASGLAVKLDGELWKTELTRIKEILERREGHAALLVGPDGVGKRALVLALATHISEGRVPPRLAGRRIIELPFHRAMASARQVGDFEKIVFTALREAGTRGDVVLFLNQITAFMGVGVSGAHAALLNAAPVIEMGCQQPGLYLLGSTTPELHREAVLAMPWCESLMTSVGIPEPSRDKAVQLLSEASESLGEFHGVRVETEAVEAAVDLSSDYIQDRVLPGKALDLLDRAASKVATAAALDETDAIVDGDRVIEALADWIDIPVTKLGGEGREELLGLEEALHRRIKGQDSCIRKVADVIRVTKLNLNARPVRPDGVFLFVGPSGVGKSELARALAEELYGSGTRLLEFNMARFSGDDGVARLIGLRFGDIEYHGELTSAVARNPHSVVVFEHIERSHRDVAVLLTQIFRDGFVADGAGSRVYLSNSTVIMTSNSENIVPDREEDSSVGFGHSMHNRRERYLQEAKDAIEEFFPPEFMDGIDEVLLFDPLTDEALKEIVQVHLADIDERLSERSIRLAVTEEAVAKLVEKGASREYGARNLGRTVEGMLLSPLARFLVAHPDAGTVIAKVVEGDIEVTEGDGDV